MKKISTVLLFMCICLVATHAQNANTGTSSHSNKPDSLFVIAPQVIAKYPASTIEKLKKQYRGYIYTRNNPAYQLDWAAKIFRADSIRALKNKPARYVVTFEVVKKFPDTVVRRVEDVLIYSPWVISPDNQLKMAHDIYARDSMNAISRAHINAIKARDMLKKYALDSFVIAHYPDSIVNRVRQTHVGYSNTLPPTAQRGLASAIAYRDSLQRENDIMQKARDGISKMSDDERAAFYKIRNRRIAIENSKQSLINSQFKTALRLQQQLDLTAAQVAAIKEKEKEQLKNANTFFVQHSGEVYNSSAFESEVLSNILTGKQYTVVLEEKTRSLVENSTNEMWSRFAVAGINTNTDTAKIKQELKDYYTNFYCTMYRFAHDKTTLKDALQKIPKPDAINKLSENSAIPRNTTTERYVW